VRKNGIARFIQKLVLQDFGMIYSFALNESQFWHNSLIAFIDSTVIPRLFTNARKSTMVGLALSRHCGFNPCRQVSMSFMFIFPFKISYQQNPIVSELLGK
jgi:hypothetical protein